MKDFIIQYYDLQGYIDGTTKFNAYEFFGLDMMSKKSRVFIYSILVFVAIATIVSYTATKF